MPNYPQQVGDRLVRYRQRYQQDLTPAELDRLEKLERKLAQSAIAIAVFGKVSTGKTSLLNALAGRKLGITGALHGVTKEVNSYEWQDLRSDQAPDQAESKVQLCLVDTQGIDEIGGEMRSQAAREAAKQADLILFVIAGDITRLEQEAIAELQNFYKPILLVFNKIDLYPDRDRQLIHQALQSGTLQQLISPQEIVLTTAEPKPMRVRLQYSDGRDSQEVWERPQPDVKLLKERILQLLNTEGQALLAINGLRSLLEIQTAVTERHLQKLQASTAIASLVFITEAIAMLVSPWRWVDGAVSGGLSALLMIWAVRNYPIRKGIMWILLIVAIAGLSTLAAELAITGEISNQISHYLQIVWAGLSLSILFKGILTDLSNSLGLGKLGAKPLMTEILQSLPPDSILQRFASKP